MLWPPCGRLRNRVVLLERGSSIAPVEMHTRELLRRHEVVFRVGRHALEGRDDVAQLGEPAFQMSGPREGVAVIAAGDRRSAVLCSQMAFPQAQRLPQHVDRTLVITQCRHEHPDVVLLDCEIRMLVVGVPHEDLSSAGGISVDAGAVNIIYGSIFGLAGIGDRMWTQTLILPPQVRG